MIFILACIASGSESEEGEVSGGEEGSAAAKRRKKRMKRRGKCNNHLSIHVYVFLWP